MAIPAELRNGIGGDDGEERDPFAAFVGDPDSALALTVLAEAQGWPASSVQQGDAGAALRALSLVEAPRRLVIDLDTSPDPVRDLAAVTAALSDPSLVLALGSVNDIALYRDLVAAGAAEYLLKPVDPAAVLAAFERAEQARAAVTDAPPAGRLAFVIGARGGVGTSLLAANAAWAMAHRLKRRTALLDLDLQFGTLALAFDLEAGRGLREALQDPDRVDDLFIDRAMARESERLMVLGAQEPLEEALSVGEEALSRLLDRLRPRFDCTLADLPRAVAAGRPRLLAAADDVLVVSELSLPGLRDTVRLLRYVEQAAPTARLAVAANQPRPGRVAAIDERAFVKALGRPLDFTIPYDGEAAAACLNAGQPLARLKPRGAATAAIERLAQHLAHARPAARSGLLRRLWRRR